MSTAVRITNISKTYGIPSLDTRGDKRLSMLIDEHGVIKEITTETSYSDDVPCIDATDLILSPGWVDFHTHIYDGVSDIGLNPDLIGPKTGVTVLVDAGSAGHITYRGLENYIIAPRFYPIYAFLNYGSVGITRANVIRDYETDAFIEPEETIACVKAHEKWIKGIKVRACTVVLGERGIEIVAGAKQVAREVGLPLMVHIGEPGPTYAEILAMLDKGDIITHCFHGKPGNILAPNGLTVIPEAEEARNKGVLFDVGHGAASFSFEVGEKCIRQGFLPDIVSTDLHVQSFEKVENLATTMAKMVTAGMSVDQVLNSVTYVPRETLGIEQYKDASLVGKRADFTLFRMVNTKKTYQDSLGNAIHTSQQFVPEYTIVENIVTRCE